MASAASLRSVLPRGTNALGARRAESPPVRRERHRILTAPDGVRLLAHFTSMSAGQRIARFHGAMSDEALEAYVRSIDWSRHWIVAEGSTGRIAAIVELVAHPREGWRCCELALSLASPEPCSRQNAAELIQIAFIAARERGARRITMAWHGRDPALALLRSFPELACILHVDEDQAVIDLQAWFDGNDAG